MVLNIVIQHRFSGLDSKDCKQEEKHISTDLQILMQTLAEAASQCSKCN